jgi:hypothetical protein
VKLSLPTTVAFWLLALAAPGAAAAQSDAAVDRAALERRLHQVEVLLETSSAAKQVESSGSPAAIERREQARMVYRQALQAYRDGMLLKSSRLLPEASVHMFEAVRMAAPEQVVAGKMRSDFDARMESVKSLLAAQKRIIAEKPGRPGTAEAVEMVENLVSQSSRQAARGDVAGARGTLDRAYLISKASIGAMRGGDTLVRSLTFATAEEEYHYEVDRNDTHRMLINVLLSEKRATAATDTMVRGFIEKAAGLRAQAEQTARSRDHKTAIRLLEESTRELVRAIRGAGVYIPG